MNDAERIGSQTLGEAICDLGPSEAINLLGKVEQMNPSTHNMQAVRAILVATMGDPGKSAKQVAMIVDQYTVSTRVVRTLNNGIQVCEALDKDGLIVAEFYR